MSDCASAIDGQVTPWFVDHHANAGENNSESNKSYSHHKDQFSTDAEANMLAARDQENLVYSHQTNAANKPLNQGIGGLQSKIPRQRAPKTPFKTTLNDENNLAIFGNPKTGLKGLNKADDNGAQNKQKDGKLQGNAFVTPLGRR